MADRPRSPLNLAAQLNADQQRERQEEEETSWFEDAMAQEEQPALLELPNKSYARAEPTEEMQEQSRQQGMQRTMKQFLAPGGTLTEEETDRPPREETMEIQHQDVPVQAEPEMSRAQRLRQAVLRDNALDDAANQAQSSGIQDMASNIDRIRHAQRIWRIVEAVEAATLIGFIVALLQLQFQVLNKYYFKIKLIPPSSFLDDVGCVFFSCAVLSLIPLLLALALLPFLLAYMIASSPGDAVRALFDGLFGGLFS